METPELKFKLSIDGKEFNGVLEDSGQRVTKFGANVAKSVDGASASVQSLTGHLVAMGSVAAGAFATQKLIGLTDAYASLNSRVALASQGVGSAAVAQQRLFQIAADARVGVEGLSEAYSTLSKAAGELGYSQQRVLGIAETLSKAMTLSGGSADSARAAMVQFGQGLQAGTLRGDELNSVLEQAPRLAQALAEGLGQPIGALKAMAEQGQITTEAIFTAMERMKGKIDTEFAQLPTTVGQAMTVMGNSLLQTIGVFDQAGGISRGFAEGIMTVSRNMDAAVIAAGLAATAYGVLKNSAVAATAVTRGLALATGALGGPIGLVATALGLGATAWLAWKAAGTGSEQAVETQVVESHEQIVQRIDQQIAKLRERNQLAGAAIPESENQTALDAAKQYTDAYAKWQGVLNGTGETAGASAQTREALLLATGKNMAQAFKRYTDLGDAMNVDATARLDVSRKDFMKNYASNGDKLALEIQAYDEKFLGKVSQEQRDKDIAAIRAKAPKAVGGLPGVSDAAKGLKEYNDLVAKSAGLNADFAEKWGVLSAAYHGGKINVEQLALAQAGLLKEQTFAKDMAKDQEEEAKALAKAQQDYAGALEKSLGDSLTKTASLDAETRAIALQTQAMGEHGIAIDSIATLLAREELAIVSTALATTLQNKAIAEQNGLTQQQAQNFAVTIDQLTALKNAAAGVADASAGKDLAQAGLDQAKRLLGDQATDPFKDWGNTLRETFATAGDGLARMVDAMGALNESGKTYAREMTVINALRKEGGEDNIAAAAKNEQALIKKTEKDQVGAYASMAGAAKTYFKEGSAGYNVLSGAEKALRTYQLVMSAQVMAKDLMAISAKVTNWLLGDTAIATSAVATAGVVVPANMAVAGSAAVGAVANQGNGDPYTAFPRIAAMMAIMAGLGLLMGGGGGSAPSVSMDSFAAQSANTGTGTVFGDAGAQSKSIENSLSALEGMARPELAFTSQMVALLRSINDGLAGTTNAILSSGFDLSGANFSGTSSASGGGIWGAIFGSSSSSTSVSDLGLAFKKQTVAEAARAVELQSYQVTRRDWSKSGFLGLGSKSGTDYSTSFADVDARVSESMSLVVQRMVAAVGAAGSKLGATPEQLAAMQGVDSGLGKVSLMGKTGDEVQQLLSAVFSAMGDNLAQAVMPSLGAFRKVGEGYLETLSRVAAGLDEATLYTDRLGIATVSLNDLKNRQGDVGAELVRQSIAGAETVNGALSGVGDVIQNFSGSASDLASLYSSLVDVRIALVAMGYSAGVVISDLIRGAGGMDALASGLSDFQSGFLSQSEQAAIKQAKMDAEFAKLGLATPATADAFKALVLGLKGSDAASQELLGRVLVLSGGMRELQDATAAVATAASKATLELVTTSASDAIGAVSKAVAAQKALVTTAYNEQSKAVQTSLDTVSSSVGKLQSLASSLKSTLNGMRISGSDGAYRASAQAEISTALAIARAGGPLPLDGQLTLALATVSKPSEQLYSTFSDYARDFYRTGNDISALADLTDAQLSVDEVTQRIAKEQLSTLKTGFDDQVKALDSILLTAQAQLDAANGNTTAVLSMGDALRGFSTAIAGLEAVRTAQGLATSVAAAAVMAGTPVFTPETKQSVVDAITYKANAIGVTPEMALYQTALEKGYSAGQLDQSMGWAAGSSNAWALEHGLPQFAIGTNSVPYDMPAYIHEDERIIPAADNRELMRRLSSPQGNNDVLIAEIRALKTEVIRLRQQNTIENVAIATHASQTTSALDQQNTIGVLARAV